MKLLCWCLILLSTGLLAQDTCKNDGGDDSTCRHLRYPAPPSNAPRPPPEKDDSELKSEAPEELPGAETGRMHGLLGRYDNGTLRFKRKRLPKDGFTDASRREAHKGFCFNSVVSDHVSVDRDQQDHRSGSCRRKHDTYPKDMPKATVIFVFHNENLAALLRSVHSVLNHSPPHLLSQILLIDDASVVDEDRFSKQNWLKLQKPLEEYCALLPKVTLVRLKRRRGLMMARMEGVWRATGAAVVFLDSHIEATPGWLEPLLARLVDDPRRLLVPMIDSIDAETFVYTGGRGGLGALSFTWSLGQKQLRGNYGDDGSQPARSAVMPGGLFAADRAWFLGLGGYDPDMKLYGGEEMEISFRTWMCGGSIESVPCSHVGHVFRTGRYWQGQVYAVPAEEIHRNKLRAAEVWMDGYKFLVKKAMMQLDKNFVGNVSQRVELRERLQCQDFKWYLDNVATDVPRPKLASPRVVGSLQNLGLPGKLCLDTLGGDHGKEIGLFSCHGQNGAQAFAMGRTGHVLVPVLDYATCMDVQLSGTNAKVLLWKCDYAKHEWSWDGRHLSMSPGDGTTKCLGAAGKKSLTLETCDGTKTTQSWLWG